MNGYYSDSEALSVNVYFTGIWPEGADGTDVNACSRSNNESYLATADDFGKVNLYKYPCCQPKVQLYSTVLIISMCWCEV